MDIRQDRRYTVEHEWVKVEGDVALIGITDHAQENMGAIVFVELPAEGKVFKAGDSFAVIESVKAAASVYAPLGGQVTRINRALEDKPELLNEAPYEQPIAGISPVDASMLSGLMNADEYRAFLTARE